MSDRIMCLEQVNEQHLINLGTKEREANELKVKFAHERRANAELRERCVVVSNDNKFLKEDLEEITSKHILAVSTASMLIRKLKNHVLYEGDCLCGKEFLEVELSCKHLICFECLFKLMKKNVPGIHVVSGLCPQCNGVIKKVNTLK